MDLGGWLRGLGLEGYEGAKGNSLWHNFTNQT